MKEKYQNYGEHDFYSYNYDAEQVLLGWSNEYIQLMESRTVSAEALIQWQKWFSTWKPHNVVCGFLHWVS